MIRSMRTRIALVVAVLLVAAAGHADADEALWTLLKAGGPVVMLRHAKTDGTRGDPPGFRLDDCATQRNLVEQGREDARKLGRAFVARGIPVTDVLSSRWCRCLETARLAFGRAEPWAPLYANFRDQDRFAGQVREMRARIGTWRGEGNLILVSHGIHISAVTGFVPDEGGLVVLTPGGDTSFSVAGRIPPR